MPPLTAKTGMMFPGSEACMNERSYEALELKSLIELAARHVQTAAGRRQMLHLRPTASRSMIRDALMLTGECVAHLDIRGRFSKRFLGVSSYDCRTQRVGRDCVIKNTFRYVAIIKAES